MKDKGLTIEAQLRINRLIEKGRRRLAKAPSVVRERIPEDVFRQLVRSALPRAIRPWVDWETTYDHCDDIAEPKVTVFILVPGRKPIRAQILIFPVHPEDEEITAWHVQRLRIMDGWAAEDPKTPGGLWQVILGKGETAVTDSLAVALALSVKDEGE